MIGQDILKGYAEKSVNFDFLKRNLKFLKRHFKSISEISGKDFNNHCGKVVRLSTENESKMNKMFRSNKAQKNNQTE